MIAKENTGELMEGAAPPRPTAPSFRSVGTTIHPKLTLNLTCSSGGTLFTCFRDGGERRKVPVERPVRRASGSGVRHRGTRRLESFRRCCAMDVVCEVCGAVGFKHLLVQCNNCKDSTRHRYCMHTVVYDGPLIEWLCDDCVPKCNEPMELLEAFCNQREQNHVQLDPSMNSMEGLDLSKEKACCFPLKHAEELSPQGTNSGSFPSINDVERYHRCVTNSSFSILPSMEQADRSSHMAESVEQPHPLEVVKPDGSDNSGLDPALENIGFENAAGSSEPALSSMEWLDLSKEKDSCICSLNVAVGSIQKSIKANDAGHALLGDPTAGCAQNDTEQLASQDVLAGDHCRVSRMPVISAPTDQQGYVPTQPIDKPCWSGIMKIGPEYISLAAHLSNKACKKVQELSRSLPPVVTVMEHPELKAWPSIWEESEPIAESIALYFFPDNTRPNKDLDRLMQYVTNHSIVLKYTVGFDNLLIFPSVFLPEKFQEMFQGKHFLWGVFKREMVRSKGDPTVKITEVAKKRKEQDKVQVDTLDQEKHVSSMNKQDCISQFAKKRKDQQDKMQVDTLDQGKRVPSVKKQGCTSQVAKKRKDQQEKVQIDTLDQENLVSKHNIPNDNQPSPDTVNGVNFVQTLSMALTKPDDDGRSSSEALAPMLFGRVHAQTPRSQRDLRLNLKELISLNLVALKKG